MAHLLQCIIFLNLTFSAPAIRVSKRIPCFNSLAPFIVLCTSCFHQRVLFSFAPRSKFSSAVLIPHASRALSFKPRLIPPLYVLLHMCAFSSTSYLHPHPLCYRMPVLFKILFEAFVFPAPVVYSCFSFSVHLVFSPEQGVSHIPCFAMNLMLYSALFDLVCLFAFHRISCCHSRIVVFPHLSSFILLSLLPLLLFSDVCPLV